jgi:hypothetical protein
MLLAEKFLLESHVSLSKFCDTMGLGKSSMHPKWVSNLYLVVLTVSLAGPGILCNVHFLKNLDESVYPN